MKLRIRGNSIRLRLMQGEVEELMNEKQLTETVQFPTSEFGYQLKLGASFHTAFENGVLICQIPNEIAQNWASSETLGIEEVIDPNGPKPLRLLIEKDLKCLTDRPHEEESDAFPNPNAAC